MTEPTMSNNFCFGEKLNPFLLATTLLVFAMVAFRFFTGFLVVFVAMNWFLSVELMVIYQIIPQASGGGQYQFCTQKTAIMLPNMKISRLFIVSLVACHMLFGGASAFVAAQSEAEHSVETGCSGTTEIFYTGSLASPADTYDIYVKLGISGQQATASAYVMFGDDASCRPTGSVAASGDEWRKLGSYTDDGSGSAVFELSSPAFDDTVSANRPALLLVPQTNPPCQPRVECEVMVAGQRGFVRPLGNSLEDNALRIVRAEELDGQRVVSVKYYVNNELMYTTKTLQDFDLRSVPYYGRTLTRVVEYSSGQGLVLESSVPTGHIDSLPSTLVRTFRQYQDLVYVSLAVVLAIVFVKLARAFVRHLHQHHEWEVSHGLMPQMPEPVLTPQQKKMQRLAWLGKRIYEKVEVVAFVCVGAALIVLVLTSYVVQVGSVRGESMVSSFQDGQRIVIDKIPVTLARLNNSVFVPSRGQVVVAQPNFGGSDKASGIVGESTIIKRVIGLPGERVVVRGGVVTVFNAEHPNGFDPSVGTAWATHIQPDTATVPVDVTLRENEIFVCGDNRPQSLDSRVNGPLGVIQVVGVVR